MLEINPFQLVSALRPFINQVKQSRKCSDLEALSVLLCECVGYEVEPLAQVIAQAITECRSHAPQDIAIITSESK